MTLINPNDSTVLSAGRASTLLPQIIATWPPYLRLSDADGVTAYYEPLGNVVSGTGAASIDDLQFIPMYSGGGGTLSEIAFSVTGAGGANSVSRCGIYSSDPRTLLPVKLLVDGGEFITTGTGLKNTTGIALSLAPATLYYTAFICGVAAPTCVTLSSGMHVFGRNAALNAQFGWVKTGFGYGALPTAAPTGLAFLTSGQIMVAHRWSAYNR